MKPVIPENMPLHQQRNWLAVSAGEEQLIQIVGNILARQSVTQATQEIDKNGIDYLVRWQPAATRLAVRVRRPTSFRDFTLRTHEGREHLDEHYRLRSGAIEWYAYGWLASPTTLAEYAVIDVLQFVLSGAIDWDVDEFPNGDRTGFQIWPLSQLELVPGVVIERGTR